VARRHRTSPQVVERRARRGLKRRVQRVQTFGWLTVRRTCSPPRVARRGRGLVADLVSFRLAAAWSRRGASGRRGARALRVDGGARRVGGLPAHRRWRGWSSSPAGGRPAEAAAPRRAGVRLDETEELRLGEQSRRCAQRPVRRPARRAQRRIRDEAVRPRRRARSRTSGRGGPSRRDPAQRSCTRRVPRRRHPDAES